MSPNESELFYDVALRHDPYVPHPNQIQTATALQHQQLIRPYRDGYILTPHGMNQLLHPHS